MKTAFIQAIKGLTRNPVRTSLTTLGIVIGIATVIVVLSAGQGFNSLIVNEVESQGVNSLTIETRVPPSSKQRASGATDITQGSASAQGVIVTTLKNRDVEDIKKLPNISGAYGAVFGQQVVSYKNVRKNVNIFATGPARFDIDSGKLESGRGYNEVDDNSLAQVAVLGNQLAQDLFGDSDPIGQSIRIGSYNFSVIGVYEKRGGLGAMGEDQLIYIPLQTAQKKLLGIDYMLFILAQMRNNDLAEVTAEDVRVLLRANHGIKEEYLDDFLVNTQESNLEAFNMILSGITFLLIAVASISLIVGGVGIMNIMYVVVTERISEIGLKKALGAKNADILWEFLIEALILTLLGGAMGIIAGAGVSYLISLVAQSQGWFWQFTVPVSAIIVAVGTASVIGLIFGVFPARKASLMDPIQALGHE